MNQMHSYKGRKFQKNPSYLKKTLAKYYGFLPPSTTLPIEIAEKAKLVTVDKKR